MNHRTYGFFYFIQFYMFGFSRYFDLFVALCFVALILFIYFFMLTLLYTNPYLLSTLLYEIDDSFEGFLIILLLLTGNACLAFQLESKRTTQCFAFLVVWLGDGYLPSTWYKLCINVWWSCGLSWETKVMEREWKHG